MTKSIDEIYRDLPDGGIEGLAPVVPVDLRLGLPLSFLLCMIALGFWTVLVPFCHGISR